MFRIIANGRTAWVGELMENKGTGKNGKEHNFKTILFRVASDRPYKSTTVENGKQVKEHKPDFVLCKAYNGTAQLIADYASAKREDGSIVSRHLELAGHLENYTTDKLIALEKEVEIDGEVYSIDFEETLEVEQSIFVVDNVQFLDPNPINKATEKKKDEKLGKVNVKKVNKAKPIHEEAAVTNEEDLELIISDKEDESKELVGSIAKDYDAELDDFPWS